MMRAFLAALFLALAATAAAQPRELDRAYEELVAAQKVLQDAEAARELGVEPQPGERLALRGGPKTRLAPEYWERQKRLEEDVDSARKRLDQALARWNELR